MHGALAHEVRMRMFRFLIERGPSGAVAGDIGTAVDTLNCSILPFQGARRNTDTVGILREKVGTYVTPSIYEQVRKLFSHLLAVAPRKKPALSLPTLSAKQLKRFEQSASDQNDQRNFSLQR